MNDITLVVGIDAKTVEQLKVSWPTWRRNRAAMWDWPWIVFYDREQLPQAEVAELVNDTLGVRSDVTLVPWPWPDCPQYESQREKMLTGHVFVPADFCRTKWHMKLDTDALARPHDKWIDPEWFTAPSYVEEPGYVAPKWHYTKGVDFLGKLDRWGDGTAEMWGKPAPVLGYDPTHLRVGHARMCSWCSYYRTAFTKLVARLCRKRSLLHDGGHKLPVPSQDTTMWYVAERLCLPKRIENMKARGWSNHPRLGDLISTAQQIMEPGNGVRIGPQSVS